MADKVKVVVNRVGSEECEITLKKAEETLGQQIFWQVPNDYKALLGARNAGLPLLQHAPRCKAHQSIVGLAAAVSGKGGAEAQPRKERRSFFSFR
jgi:pilus assembly protein CpaE